MLDRFAIDYALCMYCGICVEVCPFDALFWSPEFEYAEYEIDLMTHEKERLEEWTYKVLPPPPLEAGAEPTAAPRRRRDRAPQEYAFMVSPWSAAIAAIAVVTARNVVHAALYLVVTLLVGRRRRTCCSAPSSWPGCRS